MSSIWGEGLKCLNYLESWDTLDTLGRGLEVSGDLIHFRLRVRGSGVSEVFGDLGHFRHFGRGV